jgi:hypothetical protein
VGSTHPRSAWRAGLSLVLLVAGPAAAQDGGIEVFAAEPLFANGTRVSLTHIYESKGSLYRGSNETSNPLDLERDEHRVVLGLDRGLLPDFAVSALVPWVSKDFDSDAGDADGSGIGDVALLGKYRFHQTNFPRGTFNVSFVGGLELPTGTTSKREGGSRLPPQLQPGSGSWDPFFAFSSNYSVNRYRLDAGVFYKLNTEGTQDYEDGDFLSLSLDAKYRFLHRKYPGPSAAAKLGVQWRHRWRAEQDGSRLTNSGSDELRARTGVSWHPAPNIDFSFTVEIPVYQDFNGEQLALDYRTFLALGLRF